MGEFAWVTYPAKFWQTPALAGILEAFWPITRASASVLQIKLVISITGKKSASISPDQKQIAKPARPTISQATPLRYFVAIAPLCNSTYMQAAQRSLNQRVADNVIEHQGSEHQGSESNCFPHQNRTTPHSPSRRSKEVVNPFEGEQVGFGF